MGLVVYNHETRLPTMADEAPSGHLSAASIVSRQSLVCRGALEL